MYTKSKIQQIRESINRKNEFYDIMNYYTEKYIVEDSIFINTKKGVMEVVKGYFAVNNEYDNLNEAFNNIKEDQALRITGNNKFQIGSVFERLSECPENAEIYDIETLEQIC